MPEIDAQSPEGEPVQREETKGHIRFEDVHFRWATLCSYLSNDVTFVLDTPPDPESGSSGT